MRRRRKLVVGMAAVVVLGLALAWWRYVMTVGFDGMADCDPHLSVLAGHRGFGDGVSSPEMATDTSGFDVPVTPELEASIARELEPQGFVRTEGARGPIWRKCCRRFFPTITVTVSVSRAPADPQRRSGVGIQVKKCKLPW